MNERSVTVDGETRPLPEPFLVLATQNPIEYLGTYPLPESQLDRFLMRISLGYPVAEEERRLLISGGADRALASVRPVLTLDELKRAQEAVERVIVAEKLLDYLMALVQRTRSTRDLVLGVSPRGAQGFFRAVQAHALVAGAPVRDARRREESRARGPRPSDPRERHRALRGDGRRPPRARGAAEDPRRGRRPALTRARGGTSSGERHRRGGGDVRLSVLRLRLKIPWDSTILVRVTNLGLGFILTTIVIAIGATNTGNNGLYVLLSLFLGVLLVSGVVSRRNVDGIDVVLHGPAEIFAGEPVRFRLRLANRTLRDKTALLVKVSGKAAPLLFPRLVPSGEAERGVDLLFRAPGATEGGVGAPLQRVPDRLSSARGASTRSTRNGSSSPGRRRLTFPPPGGAGGSGRRDRSPPEGRGARY